MPELRISATRLIAAPTEVVYRCIADYRMHHHQFLPPAFSRYEVVKGGVGEGTVIRFRLTIAGRGQNAEALVAEPEPGRVLTERYEGTGAVTTFRVVPKRAGTLVVIETVSPSTGIRGAIERLIVPLLFRRLYNDELTRLDRYARSQAATQRGKRSR